MDRQNVTYSMIDSCTGTLACAKFKALETHDAQRLAPERKQFTLYTTMDETIMDEETGNAIDASGDVIATTFWREFYLCAPPNTVYCEVLIYYLFFTFTKYIACHFLKYI